MSNKRIFLEEAVGFLPTQGVSNLKEYTRLWIAGTDLKDQDSPEAEALREQSDDYWKQLSPAELQAFRQWVELADGQD